MPSSLIFQERALRIVYYDKSSTSKKVLEKDNSVSIHSKNLQILKTKIYKEFTPAFFYHDVRKIQIYRKHLICGGIQNFKVDGFVYKNMAWMPSFSSSKNFLPMLNIFKTKTKICLISEYPSKFCKVYIPCLFIKFRI